MADERKIIAIRGWASSLFTGCRVTIESDPIDYSGDETVEFPGAFVADIDNLPNRRVEILLVKEGDERVTDDAIREHLLPAIAALGSIHTLGEG